MPSPETTRPAPPPAQHEWRAAPPGPRGPYIFLGVVIAIMVVFALWVTFVTLTTSSSN